MKIVNFEPKYYDELLAFSKKEWPDKSEEYLKYRLFQFPEHVEDNRSNLLVINDNNTIIGCILYFPTKARIKGREEKIFWGHDMIVQENYRGAAGLLLLIEITNNKSAFGFGTSDINFKIQKELGTRFIGVARQYLIFNIWSFKLLLHKLNMIRTPDISRFRYPAILKVGKKIFKKISSVEEISIPENGYWTNSEIDIEFVRDEHFLRKRFFENFRDYFFYRLETDTTSDYDECYFVVRPAVEGGFSVLSIVDFRFNIKKNDQYKFIIRAASKLGRINRIPLVTLRSSVEISRFNLYPLIFITKSQEHIITNYPIETTLRLFVTIADADIDYLTE